MESTIGFRGTASFLAVLPLVLAAFAVACSLPAEDARAPGDDDVAAEADGGPARTETETAPDPDLRRVARGVRADNDSGSAQYEERRKRMVRETIANPRGRPGVKDRRVIAAMETVPREEFVPERLRPMAHADRPLPIGLGQTISQPYIVAYMTELLELDPGDVVLEIGAGSGYHAAVIAELARKVYTIEIVPELAASARMRLSRLGYRNVEVIEGDGYFGLPESAPFDAIVVTAAASSIPPPLAEQLKPGGRMVIPVGSPMMTQDLMLVEKHEDGSITRRQLMPVRFVPLLRGERDGADGDGDTPRESLR